jgi:ATP-dependent DNA helicase RecG
MSVDQLNCEGEYGLEGKLTGVRTIFAPRRRRIVRARFQDSSGEIPVIWFNQPYLGGQLTEDAGYFLYGRVRRQRTGSLEMVNPACEMSDKRDDSIVIRPVYRPIGNVGSKLIARLLEWVFENIDLEADQQEWIPASFLQQLGLPSLDRALLALHRPSRNADVEELNRRASPSHHRLIYAELLWHQLELACTREFHAKAGRKSHVYKVDRSLEERLAHFVPFDLTAAQTRALDEILADLRRPQAMMRLLQGDVGSGKTIVAALAALAAMDSGLQVAFMAPTELLAYQHFKSLSGLFNESYSISLLTSSVPSADRVRRDLARGEVQMVVGTHALIQERIKIPRLGLAIVDEQHRFGVAQRRELQRKGMNPDLLVMTATPIPRSFTLTLYGDLSRSTLNELPPGRVAIETEVCSVEDRPSVYAKVRSHLEKGQQAYVVFPFIEASERVEAASVEREGATAQQLLAGYTVAILHGRVTPEERDRIMQQFLEGHVQVLVSTTIIEVGVDVANASVIVIESAERFGLAQLHQLRGRVGRGQTASLCVALHGKESEKSLQRLELFASTADGFEIAEADLQLRGPGDILGTRQTGLPSYRIADLRTDIGWIETARRDAAQIWGKRDDPECARVRAVIESRVGKRRPDLQGG